VLASVIFCRVERVSGDTLSASGGDGASMSLDFVPGKSGAPFRRQLQSVSAFRLQTALGSGIDASFSRMR